MRILAVCLLLGLSAAHAQSYPPQPVPATPSAAALTLLGAIDIPLSLPLMSKTGLTEAVAAGVLADGAQRRYLRVRALTALAQLATPSARARIEAALDDVDSEVRIQAALSLARRFGPTDRRRVAARLRARLARAGAEERALLVAELSRLGEPR